MTMILGLANLPTEELLGVAEDCFGIDTTGMDRDAAIAAMAVKQAANRAEIAAIEARIEAAS